MLPQTRGLTIAGMPCQRPHWTDSTWRRDSTGVGLDVLAEKQAASRLEDPRHLAQRPATIVHRREDRSIPFELGRELAAGLPGASLVALGVAGLAAAPPPTAVPSPSPAPQRNSGTMEGQKLTGRETEVLALVASGRTKLGLPTRAAAVAAAAKRGLL